MLGDQIALFALGKGYQGEIKFRHKGSAQSRMRVRRHRAEIVVSKQHFLTFLFGLFFLLSSSSEKTRHPAIFHHLPLTKTARHEALKSKFLILNNED